jgi:CHAT domain-containing protein/tetratricopeptide (TPR) repeat protein
MNLDHKPERPFDRTSISLDFDLEEVLEQLREGHDPGAGLPEATAADACPAAEILLSLACGDPVAADRDRVLAHAALCADCGSRLRGVLQLLSGEATPEENEAAARQASATPIWRQRLANRLASTPRLGARTSRQHYWWAGVALAATALLAVGLSAGWERLNSPERLLAQSYSRSRIFEMRIPQAEFAEVVPNTHLRGDSAVRELPSLLEARARIERRLERTPSDPHWLQLEARADILDEKFDPAIDILDRLLAAGPVTSGLLLDDASAYFQRGTDSGSENDRATALDYLRRADELAPDDPVVLFNEALAMEDRGQAMNAVETWNRYLSFERDAKWREEGKRRMEALEQKLNRLKTHASRMDRFLSAPAAMRALAADSGTLAAIDEELSSTLLPRLLSTAFPFVDGRSRGQPCAESCSAARDLLHSLAASIHVRHSDSWLASFLPSLSSPDNPEFSQAVHALGEAIDADGKGDYASALQWSVQSGSLFHGLGNAAGEERAEAERIYALQRSGHVAECSRRALELVDRSSQVVWIHIFALTEVAICDTTSASAGREDSPAARAERLAKGADYSLLDMRARNVLGGAAIESGDTERAWRTFVGTERLFLAGDYPVFRGYTILAGMAEVEKATPRAHLSYLIQREAVALLELTDARALLPSQRYDMAIAAIRAGCLPEAKEALRQVEKQLAAGEGDESTKGFLADSEIAMANLYLSRGDFNGAAAVLDKARDHLKGLDPSFDRSAYSAAQGELELDLGHPDAAEASLRSTILDEEKMGAGDETAKTGLALQDRGLYAVLAGLWLAQGRSGEEVLALWERYRLRALGKPVPVCANHGLACLQPQLHLALRKMGPDRALGQVLLWDRVLLFRAGVEGVAWNSLPVGRQELLAAADSLQRGVDSPATSQETVDRSARLVGSWLLSGLRSGEGTGGLLLVEADPLLGNIPWPALADAGGPVGLRFSLEETPSILLSSRISMSRDFGGRPLVVGASLVAGGGPPLPEVLDEVRSVARFSRDPNVLVSDEATKARVLAGFESASAIHFAGHSTQHDGTTRLLLAPVSWRGGVAGSEAPFLDSATLRRFPPRAARLAVLSACSSGRKEESWQHGMGDIVGTLASLGVPEVVATRWQIDSAAAVPMMNAFYGGLAKGLSVPEALTAARQSLVRDSRYRHPFYWASYYASGWGHPDLGSVFRASR